MSVYSTAAVFPEITGIAQNIFLLVQWRGIQKTVAIRTFDVWIQRLYICCHRSLPKYYYSAIQDNFWHIVFLDCDQVQFTSKKKTTLFLRENNIRGIA